MKDQIEKLTTELIKFPSFEESGKNEIINFISEWIVSRTTMKPDRLGKNIVATNPKNGPKIWMLAHADTVNPSKGWDSNPIEPIVEKDLITGLGSTDMKGALAVNMLIFEWVIQQALPINLSLAVTQDEEVGGSKGMPIILKHTPRNNFPDFVIINESTPDQKISMGESGVLALKINP